MSTIPSRSLTFLMTAEEAGFRFVPPPIGTYSDRIGALLVGTHVPEIALFVGQKSELGDFIAHGTGFLAHRTTYNRGMTYLVTAKHVIDDIPGDAVFLRANGYQKSGLKYLSLAKSKWRFHPEHRQDRPRRNFIDVAVYPVDFDWTTLDAVVLDESGDATSEMIDKYDIGVGDEVIIPSLFYSYTGSGRNVPIIRSGNIAAMRDEPVPTSRGLMDGYLIESRSIGGVSGSPVLLNMAVRPSTILPPYKDKGEWKPKVVEKSDKVHLLLGLVHGYYTMVDQHEWVSKTDQQVGDINTGISIVVPVEKIRETIDPIFEENAKVIEKYDEKLNRRSGARTASVGVAAPPADDENPTHREDFTSLLNAAAKTKPQDD